MMRNLAFDDYYDRGVAVGVERGIAEGIQQGMLQGEHKKAIETAQTALFMGMTQEVASKLSGLSLEEVQQLQRISDNS